MAPITLTIYVARVPDDVGFLRTRVNKWEIRP